MAQKSNKGITLIALIITIIVLLILAMVAIKAVTGDGIIVHAKNAKEKYSEAQKNEQKLLADYELMLEQEAGKAWKQDKTKVTKGDVTLEVGDTIANFTAGGKTWKVLGEENGKLLLTTSTTINDDFRLQGDTAGWSETEKRFVKAEEALDEECAKILTAEEKAQVTEIRSMKVDDINRLTGYNPETAENGKPYHAGEITQYGNEVTYSIVKDESGTSIGIKYESKNVADKSGISTSYTKFCLPSTLDDITDITEPYTIRNTSYTYSPYSLTTEDFKAISKDSPAYIMLFKDTENKGYIDYWLASSCVSASEGGVGFGLHAVRYGGVDAGLLWSSEPMDYYGDFGVRPVVSLPNDFQPEKG